jgi:ceramide glucosyltransferase
MDEMFGLPCVVGKSMLMRKADLEAVGGLSAVRDFLAEDYVLGRLFRKAGKRIVISGDVVDNVNRYRTVREFLSRHARWNRMRLAIAGPGYLSEIIANPVFFALLLLLSGGGSRGATLLAGCAVFCKFLADLAMGRLLEAPDALRLALSGPLRDLMIAGIWFSAFGARTVTWRGRVLRIGPGSRLVPIGESTGGGMFGTRPEAPKEVAA